MSAHAGAINVLFYIQRTVAAPIFLDRNVQVRLNPSFDRRTYQKYRFLMFQLELTSYFAFLLWHVNRILHGWTESTENMMTFVIQLCCMCCILVSLAAMYTLETHAEVVCFVVTGLLSKQPDLELGLPSFGKLGRRPKFQEVVVYILSMLFSGFLLVGVGICLIGNYDPFQCIGHLWFPAMGRHWNLVLKGIACVYMSHFSYSGSQYPLILLLYWIGFLDCGLKSSSRLVPKNGKNLNSNFDASFRLHQQLQILLGAGNEFCKFFAEVLLAMGMPLSSLSAFVAIQLYQNMNPLLHLAFTMLFVATIIILFLLIELVSKPVENSDKFREYWKALGVGICSIGNYDPFQCIGHLWFPGMGIHWKLVLRGIACVHMSHFCYCGSQYPLILLLYCIVFLDCGLKSSSRLVPKSGNNLNSNFDPSFSLHQQLQILLRAGNEFCKFFVEVLLAMGMPLSSLCAFVALQLYQNMNPLLHLAFTMVFVATIIILFLLIELVSKPVKNSDKFREYWKARQTRRYDKMRLRSCLRVGIGITYIKTFTKISALVIFQVLGGMGVPLCSFSAFAALKMGNQMSIFVWLGKKYLYRKYDRKRLESCMELAFNLGAVRRVRQGTALVIVDNIVNCTVTLLCIDVSKM
ncbi:unnamed protein product [Orchesella dallaii]|uniref:Uncharacterized protein n=1 Tax=Orchesella dallaii TaxID=48710 RepID=A0ABP1RJW0_9HEXA